MIKIVRIIARLNIGGPARNAVLLTEGLNSSTFQTVLVAGSIEKSEGDMSYLAEQKGVRRLFVPELGRKLGLFRDLKALWKIYRIIREEQPDIVHTHTAKAGTLGRIAAVLAGVSIKVHTFHGHTFSGYFGRAKTAIFIWIERILGLFTDRVITVSESLKKELAEDFKIAPKDKISVIKLGLELDGFLRIPQRKDDGCLTIGIVGRLVPIKNHKMFLDVAKFLTSNLYHLPSKFIIVGGGELRQELESYAAESGIRDKVVFLGWRRDLEDIYADLDVVCLTSLNEGTPVSLIEAMASGKPVVATDVGGVRDIVKDGESGFLVKTNDVDGFSRALLKMLEDRDKRIEMGRCGREFVAENFRKERLIKDTESLYKSLLKEKGLL